MISKDPGLYILYGDWYQSQSRHAEALHFYLKGMDSYFSSLAPDAECKPEENPYSGFFFAIGYSAWQCGEYNTALKYFDWGCVASSINDELSAEQLRPQHMVRICILADMGRNAEAVELCNTLFPEKPSGEDYAQRGWLREDAGDIAGAMDDFNAAINLGSREAYPYYSLGRYLLHNGNREEGAALLQQSIEIDNIEDGICAHLAYYYLGQKDEAYASIYRTMELVPTNTNIYYDLACMLANDGRDEEAVEALRKAFDGGMRRFHHLHVDVDTRTLLEIPEVLVLIDEYARTVKDGSAEKYTIFS